jgi:hypothetical protein
MTIDAIRNSLISKLLSIKDKDYLLALDKLINTAESDIAIEDEALLDMIKMGEEDVQNGHLTSQDDFIAESKAWEKEH